MSTDWDSGWENTQNSYSGWDNSQNQYDQQQYNNYNTNQDSFNSPQQYHNNQQQSPYQYNQQANQFNGGQRQFGQPNGFGGNGFPGQQFMADPMFQAAQQFGGQLANQQKEKLVQFISGFNLKYYFAVDNTYVGKKLGILLFPFFRSQWSPNFTDKAPVPPRDDVNAPDLYIPLMAFLTYVLVSGFVLGTQGAFSPEILGILTSNAFIWVILENIIIFVSKYVLNISQTMSVWHSLAYSTYKFVSMIICLLAYMIGGKSGYFGALAYTSFALVFFLIQTVKNFVFDSNHFGNDDGRKRKFLLMLFIAVSQPLIMWWLTSGVTNFDYEKYDFARKAMGKMGLSKGSVPMTDSGEVDYEALMNMPK